MAACLPSSDRAANSTQSASKLIYYLAVAHTDRLLFGSIPCEMILDTWDLFSAHPRATKRAHTWNKSMCTVWIEKRWSLSLKKDAISYIRQCYCQSMRRKQCIFVITSWCYGLSKEGWIKGNWTWKRFTSHGRDFFSFNWLVWSPRYLTSVGRSSQSLKPLGCGWLCH